jgi:methylase of polypeptide subunit release factors
VADVGTGSGAIAIALACPSVEVWATDTSRCAVALARTNVRRQQLEDRVFTDGDGLEPYRRLVDAAATRLADGGTLLLQLHRRVVAASRAELPALRGALGNAAAAVAA